MSPFLLTLLAVAIASLGSRDQLIVAAVSEKLGRNSALLVVACAVCILSAVVMAVAGQAISALLPAAGKTMLVALALLLAAVELLWPNKMPRPDAPTRSLGAIALVLLFRQLGDGARFLVFAIAAAFPGAWAAAIGGAAGGIAAMAVGWSLADDLTRVLPLRTIRIVLGAITGILAIVIGLSARGLI